MYHKLTVDAQPVDIDYECLEMLDNDNVFVENVNPSDLKQVEQLLSTPAWNQVLNKIYSPESDGLVFASGRMQVEDQHPNNTASPVIPLSVQQEQLDSIDTIALPQDLWTQGVVDETQLQSMILVSSVDCTPSTTSYLQTNAVDPVARLLVQPSPEPTDQTVPFQRYARLPSASNVKAERCSVSETASVASMSPPPSLHLQHSNDARRLPRPDDHLTDKQKRRREQNRRAATKCRNKRRVEYETLKKNHEKIMEQNKQLKMEIRQLKSRHDQIQNELLMHQQTCGVASLMLTNSAL